MEPQKITIAGCDCGKDSLYVCVVESDDVPQNLKSFARSYKPLIVKATAEGLETLLALPVDCYVMEPTGSYSYIWANALKRANRPFKLVSSRRVRHFCEYKGLTNKADKPDAAAIAIYSLENFKDERAFLKSERLELRSLYLQLVSTTRNKNPMQNRLGQRLNFEFPEIVKTFEEAHRDWGETSPPAILRFVAGERITRGNYQTKRDEQLKSTIGCGLSQHTIELAKRLIDLEKMEIALEQGIVKELVHPEFERYHPILERFRVPSPIRAAILSRVYPFEDFLNDGKAIKEYVNGPDSKRRSGKTKRDRSEGEFKLCLGMGKELHQSGNQVSWKAGGSKYARTAMWQYVKIVVVMHRAKSVKGKASSFASLVSKLIAQHPSREPVWLNPSLIKALAEETNTSEEVASLRLHYEFQIDKKGDRRVMSTAGRLTRMLYKAFLKEFSSS